MDSSRRPVAQPHELALHTVRAFRRDENEVIAPHLEPAYLFGADAIAQGGGIDGRYELVVVDAEVATVRRIRSNFTFRQHTASIANHSHHSTLGTQHESAHRYGAIRRRDLDTFGIHGSCTYETPCAIEPV